MDVDLDRGEALIEEIQSDWVRYANRYYQAYSHGEQPETPINRLKVLGISTNAGELAQYYQAVLAPYRKHWRESMLLRPSGS